MRSREAAAGRGRKLCLDRKAATEEPAVTKDARLHSDSSSTCGNSREINVPSPKGFIGRESRHSDQKLTVLAGGACVTKLKRKRGTR